MELLSELQGLWDVLKWEMNSGHLVGQNRIVMAGVTGGTLLMAALRRVGNLWATLGILGVGNAIGWYGAIEGYAGFLLIGAGILAVGERLDHAKWQQQLDESSGGTGGTQQGRSSANKPPQDETE